MNGFKGLGVILSGLVLIATPAVAEISSTKIESASRPTLAKATGHYARTRSLLIAAVREFDKANKLVDPGALIKANEFRNILLDRVEDLDKVLAPQPRVSEAGVRFDSDTRLLGNLAEAPKQK